MKKKEEEETQKSTKPKIQKESYASVVKQTGVNFGNHIMESSLEDLHMHDDKMFRDLWKNDDARHDTYVSEKEIEEKMSDLWQLKKEEMGVDFDYEKYGETMKEFDL